MRLKNNNIRLVNTKILLFIFSSIIIYSCSKNKNTTGWQFADNSEFSQAPPVDLTKSIYTQDLRLIEGGSFRMPSRDFETKPYRFTCSSVLMSDHEVTNREYREFVNWTKRKAAADLLSKHYPDKRLENGNYNEDFPINWNDSIIQSELFILHDGKKGFDTRKLTYFLNSGVWNTNDSTFIFSVGIYPDTTCIENDQLLSSYDVKFFKTYWSNPIYDNYPVVGVSWLQALAYCEWRTDRLNEETLIREKIIEKESLYNTTQFLLNEFKESGRLNGLLFPSFRLPTEIEWILATKTPKNSLDTDQLFAWDGFRIKNKRGDYLANFNQDYLSESDQYVFTAPIKSFPIHGVKMYDLSGNVAEWVLDHSKDSTFKLIKGGAWSDSFEKLMTHNFEKLQYNMSSSRVGFRVAMDRIGVEYITK
jgi:formylglycine-generating enzyme required for sulfatase activity